MLLLSFLVTLLFKASLISSFVNPKLRPINLSSTRHNGPCRVRISMASWVDNQGNDLNPLETREDELKIISYNILGPLHGESSKHFYAPTSITKWTRRRDKLIAEIKSTSADIVCLQEVSFKALKETFVPGLRSVGLKLSGYAASKFSQTNKFSRGHKQIGCAIFVRDSKVQTIAARNVHLREFASVEHCSSSGFKFDVKGKHNCISMAFLRMSRTNRTFIVANTHLFWDPQRADIKTIQTAAAVRAISAFSNRTLTALKLNETALAQAESASQVEGAEDAIGDDSDDSNEAVDEDVDEDESGGVDDEEVTSDIIPESPEKLIITPSMSSSNSEFNSVSPVVNDLQIPSNNIPIILCGDFNTFLEVDSVAADSGFIPSSMCQLLRTGTLARDHPQHPDAWSQRRDMSHESPRLGVLQLPRDRDLLFENAYEMEEFSPFKPLFTTKTDEFQGWIDHVWINRHVQVQGVLRPPVFAMDLQASSKAQSFPPMPNADFPSDHIPLGVVARFV